MKIRDVMTEAVVTCHDRDTLHLAAHLMWQHDCGALPVVDDAKVLVGMVTDRDICMGTYTQGKAPQLITVASVMAKRVFAARPEDNLDTIVRLMQDKRVRRVPVIDPDRRPIGIFTVSDLAHLATAPHHDREQEAALAETLDAIVRPRLTYKIEWHEHKEADAKRHAA